MLSTTLHDITGGDPVQMAALMKEFRAQLLVSIDALKAADEGDAWEAAAHRLKGGALAVGATELAKAAAKAEHGLCARDECLAVIDAVFLEEMPG
ncbi:MAG: Hpt domain-containing protein [Pacificimonas sp.]